MKIALGVSQFHPGNPADYLDRAAKNLGHSSVVFNAHDFAKAFGANEFDLYVGVDSGESINYDLPEFKNGDYSKLAHWFIDYRHNKDRTTRKPTDLETARLLNSRGALICQSQLEDVLDCRRNNFARSMWLPLAADPDVWSSTPLTPKRFEVGFVGNIWDTARLSALREIEQSGIKLGYPGPGKSWKENAAAFLRESLIGFNINSFHGSALAFDVNMRVFETLACGVPLITNWVPGLANFFGEAPPFILTYKSALEIVPLIRAALANERFLQSGPIAREWIVTNATYEHRLTKLIDTLGTTPPIEVKGFSPALPPLSAQAWTTTNITSGTIQYVPPKQTGRPLAISVVKRGHIVGSPIAIAVAPDGTLLSESVFYPQMLTTAAAAAARSLQSNPKTVPLELSGPVLPLCGLWAGEFWHWVMEFLPRLIITEMVGITPRIAIDKDTPSFVTESLELLGVHSERIVRVGSQPIACEELILPEAMRGSVELLQYQEVFSELRKRMLATIRPSGSSAVKRRIFLSRAKATKGRTIKNENELTAALAPLEFEVTHLESLTFKEQVQLLSETTALVGPHGAGFVHSLWMPESSLVAEIFSPYFVHPACRAGYRMLRHRHASLLGVADEPAPRTEQEANDRDIQVDVRRVKEIVERELSALAKKAAVQ